MSPPAPLRIVITPSPNNKGWCWKVEQEYPRVDGEGTCWGWPNGTSMWSGYRRSRTGAYHRALKCVSMLRTREFAKQDLTHRQEIYGVPL